ncbi:MAG TPA: heme ABC exporter ATP-binding protein CcmA [Xanthobacteraceae bacterium]|nr:heme ABC exporter ATP-binding protein CcmA [Xanthobacteraceae bacterium]
MRLVAEGLSCVRGVRHLFSGVDVRLESGRALLVTGANGAGKSSLLRILAGLAEPAAGTLRLEGDVPADEALPAERTHYLGHLDALKAPLSVAENLEFWRAVLGRPARSVEAALAEVGLAGLARLPAALLSAGQKRRLALARLLVADRPLWLLDEPTAALDTQGQARFAAIAGAHLAAGGLIVAATHVPLDIGPCDELRLGGRPAS